MNMATLAPSFGASARSGRFFGLLAVAMALTVVAGFSTQVAMGRSTFASPLRVHLHAVVFMGWVAIFVTQTWLATRGPIALHRRLGWLAMGWMVLMVIAALNVIVTMARNGTVPFFFTPQQFLIGDPMTLVGFVGLTVAAVAMRKRTDWHSRLQICATTMLMGPAFGRLLPMPFMTPYSFEIACLAGAVFPLAGIVRDIRRGGSVHPAWGVGLATLAAVLLLTDAIAYSPVGDRIYAATVAGSPGEKVPGLAFAPPPLTALRTGR
ncbi:hypothetical protein [Sphingomonas sp. SUN039]|uniref:hypothetical protein n=1 Tax=Sphingomonas sp. SUN039 TaxID=2937787 RepID=UPI0021640CA5|nr:hypothetical protein [Sphingomonas sp. SUN039]UVO54174.1 hypothetical protein M0209_08580 [Sphingomonas sp. SUN039]